MLALLNTDIGDVWPYYHQESGLTHLYFLSAPVGTGKHWSIGHASSCNLQDWEYHGIALEPGNSGEFDDLGLGTGSVLWYSDRFYMAYTGHNCQDKLSCGVIGLAVSDDLYNWEKVGRAPIAVLNSQYYESEITGSRPSLHWRDPFLIRDGNRFHMLLCARRLDGPIKTRGTVAHLIGDDLEHWSYLPPLEIEPWCEEMECPLLYNLEGRYYLLFSTHSELIDPVIAGGKVPDGGVFCQVADVLTGPYRRHGSGRIDVDYSDGYFYAPQLVVRDREYHLIGTVHAAGGSFISDPIRVELGADGITVYRSNDKINDVSSFVQSNKQ